jgi:nucleoside-diphosphate-sugar epimerase
MIVFIAGATGAVGRPLVQQLASAGHEVIGTTRSAEKLGPLRSAGAGGIIVDARDTDALRRAIIKASPHVVIDQLTDLSQPLRPGGFDDWLQATIASRRDVTPALVDAAREAGASRVIAQSAAFMTAPVGPDIVDETRLCHVHDAAAATILALDHGSTGIYNIVDDNPGLMREWVPYVAHLVGAPPPASVSTERAEHEVGHQAVYYGTQLRGASNGKARRELGFSPVYPDWRDGFRASLAPAIRRTSA